jgi:hypothetical protein
LRTNYVQFVLAFFKHGDAEIKKQVLGVKGLVSGVFVGMDEDAYPVTRTELLFTPIKGVCSFKFL